MEVVEPFLWLLQVLFGVVVVTYFPYLGIFFLVVGFAGMGIYALLSLYYATKPAMEKCACGAAIPQGSAFCDKCGTRLPKYIPCASVIVPVYNEKNVIERCLKQILLSDYKILELIVVDDGSTDGTGRLLDSLSKKDSRINVIHIRKRRGKAAALNTALKQARGRIVVTVDADTYVEPASIGKLVERFKDEEVGGVCGYDKPANPVNWLVKLLVLSTHVSTGFVRRALSTVNCLPVLNFGAWRKSVLDKTKGFVGSLGEDMEQTLCAHELGYKIVFEPNAVAFSESPTELRVLWKQRVRWFRGFIQSMKLHSESPFLFRGKFGWFLVCNTISNLFLPVLLLIAFAYFIVVHVFFASTVDWRLVWDTIVFVGIIPPFFVLLFSLLLDREFRKDIKYIWVFPMWFVYSIFLDVVCLAAVTQEALRRPAKWEAWTKTGIAPNSGGSH